MQVVKQQNHAEHVMRPSSSAIAVAAFKSQDTEGLLHCIKIAHNR
jgi:hypothetical protein